VPFQKVADSENCTMIEGELLHDATQMKLNVLSALHFTVDAWRFI
jgi:hypothetical protein